jgi:Raf kinase inhibitor-like YbhB/YbcL family protein
MQAPLRTPAMAAIVLVAGLAVRCSHTPSSTLPPATPDAGGDVGQAAVAFDASPPDGPGADRGSVNTADATLDSSPEPDAPAQPVADARVDASPDAAADTGAVAFAVTSPTLLVRGAELVFPASACLPLDQSPALVWTGVPAGAKSLAVMFEDTAIGAVKWVVWDLPPTTTMLPADVSKTPHPTEIPVASQRGSLGRTGYSGPGTSMVREYQFTVWALDVDRLPGTDGQTTVEIKDRILPAHRIAATKPLVARGKQGGL